MPRLLQPLLLVPFLLMLAGPAVARAGTYDVYSCYAGADSFRNPGANASAWAKTSNAGDRFQPFDQCGSGSGNGFGVIAVGGYDTGSGTSGEASFSASDGTVVTRLRLYRTAWTYGTGSGADSHRNYLMLIADGGAVAVGDSFDGTADVPHGAAGSDDRAEHGIIPANFMDADLSGRTPTTIGYRVGCRFSSCPTGAPDGSFASGVNIFGAIVTVRDTSEPELTVAPGGLLGPGRHAGTETVRV